MVSTIAINQTPPTNMTIGRVAEWLGNALDYIQSMPPIELIETAERAKLARELLRVAKQSAVLIARAIEVEAESLWQLAQLRYSCDMKGYLRTIVSELEGMTRDEFESCLTKAKEWGSFVGFVRSRRQHINKELERERSQQDFATVMHGNVCNSATGEEISIPALEEAASTLLASLGSRAECFTVSDAASQLARRLGYNFGDEVVQTGLREAVREALMHELGATNKATARTYHDKQGLTVRVPSFVTYEEVNAGWVRVPWRNAGLEQLRCMVHLRRKQVSELETVAAALERLQCILDLEHEHDATIGNCAELLRRAVARKAIELIS